MLDRFSRLVAFFADFLFVAWIIGRRMIDIYLIKDSNDWLKKSSRRWLTLSADRRVIRAWITRGVI